jgi:integrase
MNGGQNVRVRLKGLNWATKRLANGDLRTYYYAWPGGPRLNAQPGSPEFVRLFHEAHATRRQPAAGLFFHLIAEFKASAEYATLAPSSLRSYASYLKLIENDFGDMPIEALTDPRVRGEFKGWRDGFAATPRKADYAWTVLARVFSFAKDRGLITVNPCERGGRLYRPDRADKIWGESDIAGLFKVAGPPIQLAATLALWTGQRQGDLLRLPWSAYDGKYIRLRQAKTGRRVVVPVGEPLRVVLDRTARHSTLVLTNSRGRPWTSDGFRTSWGKACAKAGITGLTFHDLRGSAVVRLAIADATVPQIATLTGHSLKDVEAILDAHYLGRDVKLAEIAIAKLEAGTNFSNQSQTELG